MNLHIDSLSVKLGKRQVLDAISFDIEPGQVIGLLGPNGAGKSTLMRALNGHIAAEGAMQLGEHDLAAIGPAQRAHLIAYLPQQRTIGWRLSVRDLVALGRLPWRGFGQRPNARDEAAIARAMAMVDIAPLARRVATELSGGEQARVLMARAIAQETPLLIADEPASGLDAAHQIMLMQSLKRLAAEGRTVLVSLHDLTLAARWCDEVILLNEGKLAALGKPEAVLSQANLARIYGVTAHRAHDENGLIIAPVGLTDTSSSG
ncbi:iron complex transport system ATP-binding protein [Nitratireductor aquibiodomus]|uniref:Iron complex transport system ATP-binding protein n=1 Tax=Nitratireductor aquibiodomus TaxID=204799 RepID=A0A1H4J3Y6_9HYPH|nr:ABC transporter ATP-binding protein [Nitratireductor aquibiodomus]SEB41040.1 iron complex transport system ATP-binding protein [Nitratireductor aquibiodomus]